MVKTEWGALIRQKAAKGGRLAPQEQISLNYERGDELARRVQVVRASKLHRATDDFINALKSAFRR